VGRSETAAVVESAIISSATIHGRYCAPARGKQTNIWIGVTKTRSRRAIHTRATISFAACARCEETGEKAAYESTEL
jgi:hypothetical protein